jgi:hypothetical protein
MRGTDVKEAGRLDAIATNNKLSKKKRRENARKAAIARWWKIPIVTIIVCAAIPKASHIDNRTERDAASFSRRTHRACSRLQRGL